MKNKNIIFGIHSIIEAIKSGKEIEKLFLSKQSSGDSIKELFLIARKDNIPVQFVPLEKLNKLTSKVHQGAIAFVSEISYCSIEQIIPQIYESGKVPLILILDGITDVRNFGAIARTAECAGVDAIVIPLKGSVSINADAIKTSAGALNTIPVCREKSLLSTLQYLKDSGLKIVSVTEKTNERYYNNEYKLPLALILGSEDNGITQSLIEFSDEKAKIPILGTIESLNVSVAAGIILYEVVKQRLL